MPVATITLTTQIEYPEGCTLDESNIVLPDGRTLALCSVINLWDPTIQSGRDIDFEELEALGVYIEDVDREIELEEDEQDDSLERDALLNSPARDGHEALFDSNDE